MARSCLIYLILLIGGLSGTELPDLSGLRDPELKVREKATEELSSWVIENHAVAKALVLAAYLEAESPEVRIRLLLPLERAYFQPVGYVGIIMQSARVNAQGQLPRRNPDEELVPGVRVTKVVPGTPAAASGLKKGDILLGVGDWKVGGADDVVTKVAERIQQNAPGSEIKLEVKRGEEVIHLTLKLGVLPVPSVRSKDLLAADTTGIGILPLELRRKNLAFRSWLEAEIRKDRKNLIAD